VEATLKKMTLVHENGDMLFVFSHPKPLASLALREQTNRESKDLQT